MWLIYFLQVFIINCYRYQPTKLILEEEVIDPNIRIVTVQSNASIVGILTRKWQCFCVSLFY